MNIFLPQSGNLGDTCNILPVLSGIYKHTNEKINLLVRDKMKNFKGFKELMQAQECVASLRFESKPLSDKEYQLAYLSNHFTRSMNRPWETVRYEEFFKEHFSELKDFKTDDDFTLNVPDREVTEYDYAVGDRTYTKDADTRRSFDVLKNSGKFPSQKCHYLDYNNDLITNLNIVRKSKNPFISTFTGIAILADLMNKETLVFYSEELSFWDNKPIQYSFNQHFYRDRNCELIALDDMI